MATDNGLGQAIEGAAFAFRGYNVTNEGRNAELLAHRNFGAVIEFYLREASEICSDELRQKIDLVEVVRTARPSSLETFGSDVGLIVAMELAQVRLLEEFFGIEYRRAKRAFGYSLGEVAALVAGGVYRMRDVLPPLVSMAPEAAELARDATMGVVFSRGPVLSFEAVERLCTQINAEGNGVMGISAQLAPNTILLLGQRDTVDRFQARMAEALPEKTYLRKNKDRWPPLHTPLLWERQIPNRAAVSMHTVPGGFVAPQPPILSLVTGKASYNDYNSRQLLDRWIDQPQRLWDAIYETLAEGIATVIHVGPDPNLIPATYKRLADNVQVQLKGRSLNSIGLRAVSSVWRPWLQRVLSSRTALLHAPFVRHIILEDWLLEQPLP
jgi:[acyl-carrier-protein] S-malonyltransferase